MLSQILELVFLFSTRTTATYPDPFSGFGLHKLKNHGTHFEIVFYAIDDRKIEKIVATENPLEGFDYGELLYYIGDGGES